MTRKPPGVTGEPIKPSLDLYANTYVPAWQLQVNQAPGTYLPLLPLSHEHNAEAWVRSWSAPAVWIPSTEKKSSKTSFLQQHLKHLESQCDAEQQAQYARFATFNKYDVALTPYQAEQPEMLGGLFVCDVPGVQEFTPPAMPGDLVQVRQLVPDRQGTDGYIYTARVHTCQRRQGKVILQMQTLYLHSGRFNLEFFYNSQNMSSTKHALSMAARESSTWLQSHLFPEAAHCQTQIKLTRLLSLPWYDQALNLEQQKAVQDILQRPYGDQVPYCLHGPAGTGKTKTVVEAILQVLADNPDAHILACGPSNTAADTIATRLIQHIRDPAQLLMLNTASRTFAEVPEPLLPFCHVTDGTFSLPPFQQLMRYRVIVGTCATLCELSQNRCRNADLAQFERFTMQTIHPTVYHDTRPHFTHLFIDEAGQASEPETIATLHLVEHPGVSVVLAADHKQLGPHIESGSARQSGLDVSLFERLMERSVYCDHPYARRQLLSNPRPTLPFAFPPFCNLHRNYRSHPAILMVPSFLSYDSSLAACATKINRLADQLKRIPVEFIAHEGKEALTDLNVVHAWFNETEIGLVKRRVMELSKTVDPKDIAVITPFREQVVKIRMALRGVRLGAVGVGTVEDYQGAEARVVVVSLVRTQERFLDGDLTANLGLLHQKRRMNVALTRAKELCVVIGNAALMAHDPHWRVFLKFCSRHRVCFGTPLPDSLQAETVEALSTMERAYLLQDTHRRALGDGESPSYPELTELIVGGTAQLVLDGE